MADYIVSIQGDKELAAKLRKFGVSILDLSKSMDETGRYLSRFFSGEVFASRGGVIGQPWPSLNPAYAAYKARRFPGRPPLIKSGLMNRSFKHRSTRLTSTIYNDAEYFKYHQEGRGVPERVMMALDQQRVRGVARLVGADVASKQGNAGV